MVLKFKCTLLTDVILNTKAATTGPNETLDFIPGSNFLGIVASALYPENEGDKDKGKNKGKVSHEEAMTIFHSGKVRFGDAHPSLGNVRGLKVAASMYYPKLSSPQERLYIHHNLPTNKENPNEKDKSYIKELSKIQLKQCRNGFYRFPLPSDPSNSFADLIKTETNFAIKSAHDREKRKSKDKQLFGYQSLQKGLTMYFSVEVEDDALSDDLLEKITTALTVGEKRIGRSRTAEYGLVEISKSDFDEIPSSDSQDSAVAVYADSRLIFLDENGIPTFQPTAEQLGLNGKIDWKKSQIRTFRYAPWNFKRQCFDTDRCGIEKGSVFVVNVEKKGNLNSQYVGSYKNEGFGRVIYNPSFLRADERGKSVVRLRTNTPQEQTDKIGNPPDENNNTDIFDPTLLKYLEQRKFQINVYDVVNEWIEQHQELYEGKVTSSQWGNIRAIAMISRGKEDLIEKLFKKPNKDKKSDAGYLKHGSEAKQWEGKRSDQLEDFIKKCDESVLKAAVVNLASQMSKKSK